MMELSQKCTQKKEDILDRFPEILHLKSKKERKDVTCYLKHACKSGKKK